MANERTDQKPFVPEWLRPSEFALSPTISPISQGTTGIPSSPEELNPNYSRFSGVGSSSRFHFTTEKSRIPLERVGRSKSSPLLMESDNRASGSIGVFSMLKEKITFDKNFPSLSSARRVKNVASQPIPMFKDKEIPNVWRQTDALPIIAKLQNPSTSVVSPTSSSVASPVEKKSGTFQGNIGNGNGNGVHLQGVGIRNEMRSLVSPPKPASTKGRYRSDISMAAVKTKTKNGVKMDSTNMNQYSPKAIRRFDPSLLRKACFIAR